MPFIHSCYIHSHSLPVYGTSINYQDGRRGGGGGGGRESGISPIPTLKMWPGFDSRTRRHMWVVVGCRPCSERFYSRYSGFPLSPKTNISKFQFDPESEGLRFVSRNRLLSVTLVNLIVRIV